MVLPRGKGLASGAAAPLEVDWSRRNCRAHSSCLSDLTSFASLASTLEVFLAVFFLLSHFPAAYAVKQLYL